MRYFRIDRWTRVVSFRTCTAEESGRGKSKTRIVHNTRKDFKLQKIIK